MLDKIAIPYLYNMHGHLRQGRTLALTVKIASMWCWFYAAMGNTRPPIRTLDDAIKYDEEITSHVPSEFRKRFKALVVVKVSEYSDPEAIQALLDRGYMLFKFYPFARTTNADDGITNYMIPNLRAIYELIASAGGYAMFHAEHPNKRWDDMECEYAFFGIFEQIYNLVPGLNMTWEHLSDSRVLPFLLDMDDRVACTICPHHLVLRLNDVLGQNHNLCRPPAKTLLDRETLRDAVTSGKSHKILLGLDDAPWKRSDKEGAHGHCGCWTMPAAPQRIVQIFDEDRRLESAQDMAALNDYVAWNAAAYYKLHRTDQSIELVRKPFTIPFAYRLSKDDEVVEVTVASDQRPDDYVPFMAGATLNWSAGASDQD